MNAASTMIWLWIAAPIAPLAIATAGYARYMHPYWKRRSNERFMDDGIGWKLGYWTLAVLAAGVLLAPAIRQMDHHVGANSCRSFGRNIGREVAYFDQGYWDYGCYIRTELGWVRRGDISEVELRGGDL